MGMYGHIIIYTWYWYIYIWYDIDIYVYMYIQCNLKIYRTWYNLKSNSSTLHLEHARGSTAKKDFQGLFYEECITKLSTCSPSDQETSSKQITKQPIMGYMMLYVLLFIFIWIYDDIYIYIPGKKWVPKLPPKASSMCFLCQNTCPSRTASSASGTSWRPQNSAMTLVGIFPEINHP